MEERVRELEKKIETIEKRNKTVERHKAWEGSLLRKVCIAVITYGLFVLVFSYKTSDSPWINAILPTTGFILSTLSLDIIKNFWEQNH